MLWWSVFFTLVLKDVSSWLVGFDIELIMQAFPFSELPFM